MLLLLPPFCAYFSFQTAAYDFSALIATLWIAVAKYWESFISVWYLCKKHDKIIIQFLNIFSRTGSS